MKRVVLASLVLGLALVPVLSSQPAAPPVAAAAPQGTGAETSRPMDNLEFWKYALTQGGLTIVCLVLFWWITRDLKRREAVKDEDKQILIGLVDKNTVALTTMDQTCQRLARELEARRV